MNEQASKTTDTPILSRPAMAADSSGTLGQSHSLLTGIAMLLAIAALGTSGWLGSVYFRNKALFDSDIVTRVEQFSPITQQMIDEINAINEQITGLKNSQTAVDSAIEGIHADLGRDRSDWMLAEVEHLLIIANHRLQLAHDIDTSIAALKAADQQLLVLGKPRLLPVRKAIATEIGQLESLERTDIAGLVLRIDQLASKIDTLPVIAGAQDIKAQSTTPVDAPADKAVAKPGFARQLWDDVLGLIRIRTTVENYRPLLAPEQSYFLRENLRLQLQGAQLALLAGDSTTYQRNLASAQVWAGQYFDNEAQPVKHILDEVAQLKSALLVTKLPDISGSLETLRRTIKQKEES